MFVPCHGKGTARLCSVNADKKQEPTTPIIILKSGVEYYDTHNAFHTYT